MSWLLVAVCILISFMFSGIEAGILSVNRVRLRHRLKMGDSAAIRLQRLLSRPERVMVTVLITTNLANIVAVILTTREFVRMLGGSGYWISLLVCLPFYLLLVELLPKSLFRRFPYRALAAFSEFLRIADFLLSPALWLGGRIARWVLPRRRGVTQKLFSAREDFKYFTIESERTGTLTKEEREMIHNVVDFRSVRVRDVMVPLKEVRTVPASATVEEVIEVGTAYDLDRLPVTENNGTIIGLVNVFEMLLDRTARGDILPHVRRIVKVNADEPAYRVIRKLRAARISMASVVDSQAHPIGIVSSEDLVKRLVSSSA